MLRAGTKDFYTVGVTRQPGRIGGNGSRCSPVSGIPRRCSIPIDSPKLDQTGSGNGLQEIPVRQSFFQMPSRNPSVFTGDALGARSLPVFDGIDERPMMLLRDGADFMPPRHGTVHDDVSIRCSKREPINLIDHASQSLVFGKIEDG